METTTTPIAFSGNIPANYDSFLGPFFFEPYAKDMSKRIAKLNCISILEVASGTGRLTKMLSASLKEGGTLIASDINPAMVNFGKTQTSSDVKWMEIDAMILPFEDNAFDCVVSQFGVMFYPDRIRAFKEAFRVLKQGGTFIFNCWDKISNNPIADITNNALAHFFPVDTPAFYKVPFSYFDEELIESDLKQSGFKKISIEVVALTGHIESAGHAAKGLIKGTPTITAIEERDKEKVAPILTYVEEKISKTFGKGPLQIPLQARVVTCLKD